MTVPWKECASPENTQKDFYVVGPALVQPRRDYINEAKSGGASSSIDPKEWLSETSTSPSPQLTESIVKVDGLVVSKTKVFQSSLGLSRRTVPKTVYCSSRSYRQDQTRPTSLLNCNSLQSKPLTLGVRKDERFWLAVAKTGRNWTSKNGKVCPKSLDRLSNVGSLSYHLAKEVWMKDNP